MIRISGVIKESIVDGNGIRFTLFTQGCPHKCEGCHNPQTHDFDGGYFVDGEKVISEVKANPLLAGITFSGGEPILQAKELIPIAQAVTEMGKDCVIYSGYTLEELIAMKNPDVDMLLSLCTTLIDGKFVLAQKDLTLRFRGSKNQRIIDLKETIFHQNNK